jgi:hypothetical protein
VRLARAFSPFLLERVVFLGLRPPSADFDLGCFSAAFQAFAGKIHKSRQLCRTHDGAILQKTDNLFPR